MALAHSKGILVDAQHYGNIQESFRGFAIQLHGKLHITLNLDQDEVMQQVCLAHELERVFSTPILQMRDLSQVFRWTTPPPLNMRPAFLLLNT